jgi:transposase-like protein
LGNNFIKRWQIMICKHCGSSKVVKKGLRKLRNGSKQVYSCKDCGRRFAPGLSKKWFNVNVILSAVNAYNQGYSLSEACDLISRQYKVIITKSSVSRWVQEYNLGYTSIRSRIIKKHGNSLIIGRMFKHSGLVYNFKYHKAKLNEFGKYKGLKEFVFELSRGVEDRFFLNSNRCSQAKERVSVNVKVYENTKLNKAIGEALKLVSNNKQRHCIVENFLLSCDRDTIAVEVPVWYWDKIKDVGVSGHIDILQVKYGKVWVLDYKPDASSENIDKVASQLYNYALGISFRAKISLKDIKCGWFDENKVYSFDASKVKTDPTSKVDTSKTGAFFKKVEQFNTKEG